MAQAYRCRTCGHIVTLGVPHVRLTQEVSAALSAELGRPVTFHDWGPHATDRELHRRGEQIWDQKTQEYYALSGNVRELPDTCPKCGAPRPWEITITSGDL